MTNPSFEANIWPATPPGWTGGFVDPQNNYLATTGTAQGQNNASVAANYGNYSMTQTTSHIVQAGDQFKLTVAIGSASSTPHQSAPYYVGLVNIQIGGVTVASNTLATTGTAATGSFADAFAVYTATSADVGKTVGIQLGGPLYTDTTSRRYFDNVRLEVIPHGIGFAFTVPTGEITSAGVFNSSNQLVKTLWRNVPYIAGSHTGSWDGTTDSGSSAPTGATYTIKVLGHDNRYIWDGVIGNTSSSFTGSNTWISFSSMNVEHSLSISGTKAFETHGYFEGRTGTKYFNTSTPQAPIDATPPDQNVVWGYIATDGTNYYTVPAEAGTNTTAPSFAPGMPPASKRRPRSPADPRSTLQADRFPTMPLTYRRRSPAHWPLTRRSSHCTLRPD